jgi:ABC-2 type transport system ATP-binding protein
LREVEKICSRVGIIRAGELVEVASISQLKAGTMHHLDLTTIEPLRLADFKLPGATIIEHTNHSVSLRVKGELAPFVRALSAYTVIDLEVTHSSLEEILLEYYK